MKSAPGPTARVRFDSYGKKFGPRTILKSASAWAWPGRITLLMGRNGCGKTTLLRCGLGLAWSDFGIVLFDGRPIKGGLASLSRAGLNYLPDRRLLSPRLTLQDHVEAFARAGGGGFDPTPAASLEVQALLDLKPGSMSGGERRRAEIWLTVAAASTCLIADEPFLGIAPTDRGKVATALRNLAAAGAAILLTGHEVEDLFELADDVIWMVAGTTHGLGAPSEAASHAQFRLEYLGTRAPSPT
jgi:ABC-type multidrug transport system ATPase subunit